VDFSLSFRSGVGRHGTLCSGGGIGMSVAICKKLDDPHEMWALGFSPATLSIQSTKHERVRSEDGT